MRRDIRARFKPWGKMISVLLIAALWGGTAIEARGHMSIAGSGNARPVSLSPQLQLPSEVIRHSFLTAPTETGRLDRVLRASAYTAAGVAGLPAVALATERGRLLYGEPESFLLFGAGVAIIGITLVWAATDSFIRRMRHRRFMRRVREKDSRITVTAKIELDAGTLVTSGPQRPGLMRDKYLLLTLIPFFKRSGLDITWAARISRLLDFTLLRHPEYPLRLGIEKLVDRASGKSYLRIALRDESVSLAADGVYANVIASPAEAAAGYREDLDGAQTILHAVHSWYYGLFRKFGGIYEIEIVRKKVRSRYSFYRTKRIVSVEQGEYAPKAPDGIYFSYYLPLGKPAFTPERRKFLARFIPTRKDTLMLIGVTMMFSAGLQLFYGLLRDMPGKSSPVQPLQPVMADIILEIAVRLAKRSPAQMPRKEVLLSSLQESDYWKDALPLQHKQKAEQAAEIFKRHAAQVKEQIEEKAFDYDTLPAHEWLMLIAMSIHPDFFIIEPPPAPRPKPLVPQEPRKRYVDTGTSGMLAGSVFYRPGGHRENQARQAEVIAGKDRFVLEFPDFSDDTRYQNWISGQYGTMALDDYPHLTTKLIMQALAAHRELLRGAVVLEAGAGDGLVAVLCEKLGAQRVYAVEQDEYLCTVAEQTRALNGSRNVEIMRGDFLGGDVNFEENPTVAILNQALKIPETLEQLLKKYPTVKIVFLTSWNLCCGRVSRAEFDRLMQSLTSQGMIAYSAYAEKPVYYRDVFDEGFRVVVLIRDNSQDRVQGVRELLRAAGFKYADAFAPDLELNRQTGFGRLQMLAVSGDGEYVYALRRRFENFHGQGDKETVSYRLMELNPFMDAGAGAETQEGFCEIYFHDAHKTAYLGMGSRMVLAVSKQGVGLGALLLQFALDEALSRGMQEIRISTAVRQAIPFYEKFGFRLVGPRGTEMVRDLTQRGSEKVMFPDAGAVHAFHNFGRIDFRGHQPQVTRALFSRITDNTVMRDFLDWEERLGMGTSYRDVILRLWKDRNRLVREIFARVESLGEESIRQAGRDMLKEFNERPENREEDTTLDWLQLAARRTTGQYDLSQLLSQTLGMAYMYLQLKKKDYSEADLRKIKENTEECLHEGILILRAIALAEKEKEKKAEEEPWQSVRLPKLKAQAASRCVAEIIQEAI